VIENPVRTLVGGSSGRSEPGSTGRRRGSTDRWMRAPWTVLPGCPGPG